MYKIYTRNTCIYCDMAKSLMKEQGHKTVPQIYNEVNSHIGGYTELLDIFKKEI